MLSNNDISWLRDQCPSITDEEAQLLDSVLAITEHEMYIDGYLISDLVDAYRIGVRHGSQLKNASHTVRVVPRSPQHPQISGGDQTDDA